MISNFLFDFVNICVKVSFFFTKLLTLNILFSTALKAAEAAKVVIVDILFLTSFILALREVVVVNLVILDISPLTSFI